MKARAASVNMRASGREVYLGIAGLANAAVMVDGSGLTALKVWICRETTPRIFDSPTPAGKNRPANRSDRTGGACLD
jgi:hypothetical protein